jgi:hypothetical protein
MIPKGKLLALVLVFGAVGTLAATGAFTTVEAERTADVDVAGDANALLAITPAEDTNDSSFIQQDDTNNQAFEIVLQGDNNDADGLNTNSTTTAENIFNITNNGEEDVDVWINTEGGAQENNSNINTTFYIDDRKVGSSKQVTTGTGQDAVTIGERITEFNALVDDDGGQNNSDIVISESRSPTSVGESPDDSGIAVNINPGQTVTVSMAIEIESDATVNLNSDDDPILNETTILAVNDEESSASISEGSTTTGTESNDS